ncbi:hypothetical protein GCM10009552_09610 [Rothia nasimurium]
MYTARNGSGFAASATMGDDSGRDRFTTRGGGSSRKMPAGAGAVPERDAGFGITTSASGREAGARS